MVSFATVYISPHVRSSLNKVVQAQLHRKFWELVSKLRDGRFEIPGLNVEKLQGKSERLYSARMSRDFRLIFSMIKESNTIALIIHEINHHDKAYERADRSTLKSNRLEVLNEENLQESESQANARANAIAIEVLKDSSPTEMQLFRVPQYLLLDPSRHLQFEKSLDRYLRLSEEQEDLLAEKERCFLIQGPAGTGKTTLALFFALQTYEEQPDDLIYLFTYHEELACVCRSYKVNLLGTDEESSANSGIKVFSYLDFCRRYLKKQVRKENKQNWIDKDESLSIIRQILNQKSRWLRNFDAADLYGTFYSILKGRFMPDSERLPSSREDYERIFRDYGRMPDSLEDTLEIFSFYQAKLEQRNFLDEADLIRLSYETLKSSALLADAQKKLWIVIDEIQDFTELEWKSILLFWENHCTQSAELSSFPLFCGDTNQNISRSGFRWQELESYLQTILKKIRRPNALKKVQLHKNYRNTQEIHKLATFLRKLGAETQDLGLAPETTGEKPVLVKSNDDEFLQFLLEKDESSQSDNPLVVLVENAESLDFLQRRLSKSRSIFILPLSKSKGLEFEDVIIYRAFSSAENVLRNSARIGDLWYMGMSRARKNLLLVVSNEDYENFLSYLSAKQIASADFFGLVDLREQKDGLENFWTRRELEMPNYNVIFLERKIADELFERVLVELSKSDNEAALSPFGAECRDKALLLWNRCFDYAAQGKALVRLNRFEQAISYLKRAGLDYELAQAYEKSDQLASAAAEFEKLEMWSEAARCCEKQGEFQRAGILHARSEDWETAAQCFHKCGNLEDAANASEEAGLTTVAANLYEQANNFKKAAVLQQSAGLFTEAGNNFLRCKDEESAAHCFHRGAEFEKAIVIYEKLNRWDDAACVAKDAELNIKAADYFLRSNKIEDAAIAYAEAGEHLKSAELFIKIKSYGEAADQFEKAKRLNDAALASEQATDYKKALELAKACDNKLIAARCYDKLSDFENAILNYLESGAITEAALAAEKKGDYLQASKLYVQADNNLQAANCLAKIDKSFEAAKLYVVSGQVTQAFELISSNSKIRSKDEANFRQLLSWCFENKKVSAAAQLLELKKDFKAAAGYYKECMMFLKQADSLEKCKLFSEAAEIYEQNGEMSKAADCFKQSKNWKRAGKCFESVQNWSEAKSMYERCNDEEGIIRCKNAINWL